MCAGGADALEELARDLSSSSTADRERAVSMLSSLTPYLEYHSVMLGAGVVPALMKAVLDARMIPQVSLTGEGSSCALTSDIGSQICVASSPAEQSKCTPKVHLQRQIRVLCLQVRVIALGCAADLLKENDAKKAAASNPDFIPNLLNALKACLSPCYDQSVDWWPSWSHGCLQQPHSLPLSNA